MTKNHIFIKSVALGALLLLSPLAHASVDQVLVTYFNKVLYKDQSPKCSVDDATKTRFLAELEPKCLIRSISNGEPFISGVKSECGEIFVKATVDTKVQSLCANTAAVQQEKFIAQQQAAAAKQQAAVASGSSGSGGGSSSADSKKEAKDLYKLMNKVSDGKIEKSVKEYADKGKDYVKDKVKSIGRDDGQQESTGTGASYVPVTDADRQALAAQQAARTQQVAGDTATKYQGPEGTIVVVKKNPTMTTIEQINPETGEILKSDMVDGSSQAQIDAKVKNLGGGEKIPAGGAPNVTELSQQTDAALAGAQEAANQTPAAAAAAAKDVAGTTPQGVTNTANEATKPTVAAADAKDQSFVSQAKTALVAAEKCLTVAPHAGKIATSVTIRSGVKKICNGSSATAGFLCPLTTSPAALKVQTLMAAGTAVLSKATAASESCEVTSNISKVAQAGMLAGQLTCTTAKYSCDGACGKAQSQGQKLIAEFEALKAELAVEAKKQEAAFNLSEQTYLPAKEQAIACQSAIAPVESAAAALKAETEPVAQKIIACQKHSADIALMGINALGLLSASQDAQKCKEQLTAGGSGKSTNSAMAGPLVTTAEYCSQPSNASSIMCKCTANPTADGCIGSAAGSGLALGKVNTNGTLSGFAGPGKGNGNTLADAAKKAGDNSEEPVPGAGLSEAAREALGLDSASSVAAAAGGGGGSGESAPEAKAGADKDDKAKPRFSLMSSIGSMFSSGSKPSQAAKAAIRGYEQEQAIKRKVASEQIRSQITTASGKSNFDKIKSRYQSNVSSFEQ